MTPDEQIELQLRMGCQRHNFSRMERDVAEAMVLHGSANAVIASALNTTVSAVLQRRASMRRKTGTHTSAAMMSRLLGLGSN